MSYRGLLIKRGMSQDRVKNVLAISSILLGTALVVAMNISITSAKRQFAQLASSQSSINTLFDTLMGFGFLTLLLGGFLINVTINEYARKMKGEFSVLKVLGAKRSSIIILVLEKSLVCGCVGAIIGGILGVVASSVAIKLVGKSINSGGSLRVYIPYTKIIFTVIGTILLTLCIALPVSLSATKKSIVMGFKKYEEHIKINNKMKLITAICFVTSVLLRVLLKDSSVGKLETFVVLSLGIYLSVIILFKPFVTKFSEIICMLSPFNGFVVKNNILKEMKKSANLVVIFTGVIALSLGIYSVVNEISVASNKIARTTYYGDAVVSPSEGENISDDVYERVSAVTGVYKAFSIYEKYIMLKGQEIQLKGYVLDKINIKQLALSTGVTKELLEKLKERDTILMSAAVMKKQNLNIGDCVSLNTDRGTKTLRVIGRYQTINNNGKVGVISDLNFRNYYRSASINMIIILKKGNISYTMLKNNIFHSINKDLVQVNNIGYMIDEYKKSNSGFIEIIDCMIFILVVASLLILINSISINIKSNEYTVGVIKLLGTDSANIIFQNVLEGLCYGVLSTIIGEGAGIILSWKFTQSMNKSFGWNLNFNINSKVLIFFGSLFILTALVSSIIASLLNYSNDFRVSLRSE